MKLRPLLLIGLSLILAGLLFGTKPKYEKKLIDIDTPEPSVVELVKPISSIITDPNDKAKLALFNYEFGNRLPKYEADTQKLNDVYVLAASKFFKDSLVNKYENLDVKILKLISEVTTDNNSQLTSEQKQELSKRFIGLSWSLINK
jgi:hypothetical protein